MGLVPADVTDTQRIVIVETEQQIPGMLVDSVSEVAQERASAIEPPPNVGKDKRSRYVQGVCNQGDSLLIIVDIQKLFGAGVEA